MVHSIRFEFYEKPRNPCTSRESRALTVSNLISHNSTYNTGGILGMQYVPCELECCPCDSAFDAAFENVAGLSFVAALAVDLAKVDGLGWGLSDCTGSVVCEWAG